MSKEQITPEQIWDAAIKWYQHNERMNYIPETEEEYREAVGEQQRELSQFVPPNKEQFCSKYGISTPVTDEQLQKEAEELATKYHLRHSIRWDESVKDFLTFARKHSVTPVLSYKMIHDAENKAREWEDAFHTVCAENEDLKQKLSNVTPVLSEQEIKEEATAYAKNKVGEPNESWSNNRKLYYAYAKEAYIAALTAHPPGICYPRHQSYNSK